MEAELIGRHWTREGEGRLAYLAALALAMWKFRTLGDEDLGKEGAFILCTSIVVSGPRCPPFLGL